MKILTLMSALVLLAACSDLSMGEELTADEQVLMTALSGEEEDLQSEGFSGDPMQGEQSARPPLFRECDAHGDFEGLFQQFDADASRSLEGAEEQDVEEELGGCSGGHKRHQRGHLDMLMKVYDLDEDGELSDAEREVMFEDFTVRCDNLHAQLLEEYDVDGDGELSEEEEEQLWLDRDALHEERRDSMEECRSGRGDGPPPPPPWLVEFDADEDGELSGEELETLREEMRERLRSGEPPGEPPC